MPFVLEWLRRHLRAWLGLTPPKPKPLTVTGVVEKTVLRYTFGLPPEPAIDDLDHRELNVVVEDGDPTVKTISKGSTAVVVDFDRDKNVSLTLVDVDTSSNKSTPSDPFTFLTTDTVPPPKPGGLSVMSIEQVDDPVPAG